MTHIDSLAATPANSNDPIEPSLGEDIVRVLTASEAAGLSAPEIAHLLRPDGDWHALLAPIRRAGVALALEGRLIIYRKGKIADPAKFSGVYRIGLPRQD